MRNIVTSILDGVDVFLAWLSSGLGQTMQSYCDIQTADSPTVLVGHDGSLLSILRLHGVRDLIGSEEFDRIQLHMRHFLQTSMAKSGHAIQFFFSYNKDSIVEEITEIFRSARETAEHIELDLEDLFQERTQYLSKYCSQERVYIALWTRPSILTTEQLRRSNQSKIKHIKAQKIPPFRYTQNILAAIPDLRDTHDSFVRILSNEMTSEGLVTEILEVHEALRVMRETVDIDFTSKDWRPFLPGDKITIKDSEQIKGDISDVLWPPLARQLLPRDAENINLRTVRIGDRIYASVFIDLFPKEIQSFFTLFAKVVQTNIPWRVSFLIESNGLESTRLKAILSSILGITSSENRLLHDSLKLLQYINVNTDDSVVKLRVAAATWAPDGQIALLRSRAAQLARAIESWGSCSVSEVCGDAFLGAISSTLAISGNSVANASIAPLSDVLHMLPLYRPCSPWTCGAVLFRSPDGKPWPFQPGSSKQTTWIDILYARPGSGKSVLSNAINLALVFSAGLQRLPRISIIDVGFSSSGYISLLREALPAEKQHYVVHHRLRMTVDHAINPFDTQLGSRYPTPQERSFLVNFLTLLATPVGSLKTYDGIPDMVGLVMDELYREFSSDNNSRVYTRGIEEFIDSILDEISFIADSHTTWWEVTDALFIAGFTHEAMLAQRHAMPVLGDVTSICRSAAVEDLYGEITVSTGENIINAFLRMISGVIRSFPNLTRATKFDLGDARIISLDLDEVAKSGGDTSSRQTAVMYMLARHISARDYFLTEENVSDMHETYRDYHAKRIAEIKEDLKRIVMDEFHRTSGIESIRKQIVQDMREGRKWNIQISLISQSLDDFDRVMIEFATSVFIMDAGPEQAIQKTTEVFGLSKTAQVALRTRVHGPREEGATFLAQFATKNGINTQLLTLTLGPIELWAFSTTALDVKLRNILYEKISPIEARCVLARLFPSGSAVKVIEKMATKMKKTKGPVQEEHRMTVLDKLVAQILGAYAENPKFNALPDT